MQWSDRLLLLMLFILSADITAVISCNYRMISALVASWSVAKRTLNTCYFVVMNAIITMQD